MSAVWTLEVPTKPGWYWYYGFVGHEVRQTPEERGEPTLRAVQVMKISNGTISVMNGHFLNDYGDRLGFFTPMQMPELPSANRESQDGGE